jgi:DNA-binding GntR family transcriptional regulator
MAPATAVRPDLISLALPDSEHGDLADRHLPILDALRSHDAAVAEAAMYEHLADVAQRMRLLKPNPNEEKTS